MPTFPAFLGWLKKHWSVPAFFAVVVAADIGSRAGDRFRSPCARHDTRGALSRILIDRRAGYDLALAAIKEGERTGDRVACAATFAFIRPGTLAQASLPDVVYIVTRPEGSGATIDIPASAWERITAAP